MSERIPVQLFGGFHDGLRAMVAADQDGPPDHVDLEEVPIPSGNHLVLGPDLDPMKIKPTIRYRLAKVQSNGLCYDLERPATSR